MRARTPDRDGYVEREGVKVFYEVFGDGEPAILLLPAWSVVHSRSWKSPQRIIGQIFICPTTPLAPFPPPRLPFSRRFEEALNSEDGWAKDNARYWERDYRGFLEFFFAQVFTEPHSTKPMEDRVMWGLETTSQTLTDTAFSKDTAPNVQDVGPAVDRGGEQPAYDAHRDLLKLQRGISTPRECLRGQS